MPKNNHSIAFFSNDLLSEKRTESKYGKRFLQFSLKKNMIGLIPLEDLQGTIKVSLHDILPVPQVAEYWLGIANLQGEAVWMLDFLHLLGGQNWYRQEAPAIAGMAMLIKIEQQTIGLLVEKIAGIEIYNSDRSLPVTEINGMENLQSIFKHYFLNRNQEPAMLLDINSLILMLQEP